MFVFRTLLTAGLASLIAACATVEPSEAPRRFDTFETSADIPLTSYDTVFIAPIAVGEEVTSRVGFRPMLTTDRTRPLSEDDIDRATTRLRTTLIGALDDVVAFADAPGEDVLTIAVELTDLQANRPTSAELAAVPGLSIGSIYTGGAAVIVNFAEGDMLIATATDRSIDLPLNETNAGAATWFEADRYFNQLASKVANLFG